MAVLDGGTLVAAVVAAALLPAIGYAAWVRHTERFHREPWRELARVFAWGATGGVVLALVLESALGVRPDALGDLGVSTVVFGAVVVAPLVEEFTKALGLRWVRDDHPEPEDGYVYGAAAGLGFAATENLAYAAVGYLEGGLPVLAGTLVLRTFSSALLHATATAIVGHALWLRRMGRAKGLPIGAYLTAVALHAFFNLGASAALVITALASIALALAGFVWVRRRVRALDARGARAFEPP